MYECRYVCMYNVGEDARGGQKCMISPEVTFVGGSQLIKVSDLLATQVLTSRRLVSVVNH